MLKKTRSGYRFIAAFLFALAVADGTKLWEQRTHIREGYGDFCSFYTAASLVRQGKGRFLYDLREQWAEQQKFAPDVAIRKGPLPFMRPPFESLFYLPLAYFRYPVALALWTAAKLVLLWLTAWILPRPKPFGRIYPAWLEAVLCLGLFPVFLDLLQGQDAILLLFIVAATFNRLQSGKDVAAGMTLALGLFKFHLVAPIAIMIWLGARPRILAGFVPVATSLVAISCAISGVSVLHTYPAYVITLNRVTGVGVIAPQTMPNLRGLLTTFFAGGSYSHLIFWLLLPTATAAAVAATIWLWRSVIKRGFQGLALGYFLTLLTAIVTSLYAYSYDMTILIVPLLMLGGEFLHQPELPTGARYLTAVGLLLLICTPLYWALFRVDYRCLLIIPLLVLALGIAALMRTVGRSRAALDLHSVA